MKRGKIVCALTASVLATFISGYAASAGIISFTPPTGPLTLTGTPSDHGISLSGELPLNIPTTTVNEIAFVANGGTEAWQWGGEGNLAFVSSSSTIGMTLDMSEFITSDPAIGARLDSSAGASSSVIIPANSFTRVGAHGEIDGSLGAGSSLIFQISVAAEGGDHLTGPGVNLEYDITTPGPYFIRFDKDSSWVFTDFTNIFYSAGVSTEITGTGTFHIDPGFGFTAADTIPPADVVPEPSTIVMSTVLLGIFGAGWARSRLLQREELAQEARLHAHWCDD